MTNDDHDKYITTPDLNKLTAENFDARLKQENLASKSDITNFAKKREIDNILLSFDKRINSNKTKNLMV